MPPRREAKIGYSKILGIIRNYNTLGTQKSPPTVSHGLLEFIIHYALRNLPPLFSMDLRLDPKTAELVSSGPRKLVSTEIALDLRCCCVYSCDSPKKFLDKPKTCVWKLLP